MQTKLTLRLDENLIAFGKRWASDHGKTLSALVGDYLATLERLPVRSDLDELPPLTRSLLGLASGEDEDAYRRYVEEKYQ